VVGNERGEVNTITNSALSICSSLLALTCIALVWVAGNSEFGLLATVWQITGVMPLLLLSASLYAMSAALCYNIPLQLEKYRHVSFIIFVVSVLPFLLFLLVLAVRY